MRIALAGDVALDLVAPVFREAGHEVYVPAGFGAWRQEVLDVDSPLNRFKPDLVFDVTAHDKPLAAEVPGFFDERMRALASMPYSLAGIRALVAEAEFAALASPRKVLALDADNTLWRGILSEDGRDALAPCVEFQKGVLRLRDEGVALVLLTKNDAPRPQGAAFMRPDMPLKDADFAALRINWAPKAGNLVEACRELNVGVESVVFVDDNPHERAQMAAHLPDVAVAPWNGWSGDVSREPAQAAQLLRRLRQYFFAGMGTTAEDRLRAADYASPARRLAARYKDAGEYLASLGLWAEPAAATAADIPRLAQMAGKTNQFNATTLRRTADDFAGLLDDPSKRVFVFRAGDRFGEQGIVCYIVADLAAGRLTDFVMSCRAMGRTLEHFAFAHVVSALGYSPKVDYSPSAKNAPFKSFLDSGMSGKTYYRTGRP